ncbi:unnamed protein product [Echinostoma caproni]|uniref:Protein-lysine N-methyltransferase SMYD4 n=1 Tax=Echinostoma caproni TaxID=27848 RepID=A0A183ADH8_9TREM|nr:unnamed protein product [Echinostoma caproni]
MPPLHLRGLVAQLAKAASKRQVEEAKTDLIELQSQLENTPNKRAINDLIERNLSLCANILNGLGSPSNNDCDPSNDIDFFGELPLSNTSHKSKGRKKGRSRHPMCSVPFDVIYNGDALGWGLIASRDIQPAEMVIMEKPYVAVTGMPGIGLLCEECLRWCVNPIPCRSCSEVVFCSEECEQASWATSWVKPEESSPRPTVSRNRMPHSLICGQLERLSLEDYANWKTLRQCNERGQKSDVLIYCQRLIMRFDLPSIGGSSDAILAYACVASTPPWIIGELVQTRYHPFPLQHPTNSGKVDSPLSAFSGSRVLPTSGIGTGDYRSIGWLETNSAKRTPWDLWQRTVAAVFLTHCLSDGGYPLIWSQPDCIRDPGNCQEIARGSQLPASWAAACILYHLQSVQLNGFVMKGRIVTIHDALPRIGFTPNEHQMMVRERPGYLGSALYPTLSLVNHSCDPNCALIFMRDGYCGLFATEHIAKGSALLISYGVHYTTHSLFQRRQELKHFYQFECSCQACRDNQYGAESQWDMICSRCSRPFSPHEMRSKRIVQPNRCLCSSEIKRRDFDRVSRILQELPRNNVEAMILKYLGAWGQGGLSSSLESHIANAARQLNQNNLGGCIARYGLPLVDLKKHLMKLLQYRFGFRFLELQIDPLIELLNCLTLDSGL